VGAGGRDVQECERVLERARFVLGLRRGEGTSRADRLIRGEPDGPLLERGGGRQASACLGAVGGAFEFRRDQLVRAGGRRGKVPGPTIRIDLRVGRLGQRAVHPPPLPRRCRPVQRRADQRMAKPHPAVDVDQPGRLRRLECRSSDRVPPGSPPQERRVAGWLRCCHEQQPPGVRRQCLKPPQEALLDPSGQRHRAGQPEAARQLGCAEPSG
jgi:hypothetical protein